MKWLMTIIMMFSLTGCFASLSHDGILSTISSTGAATLGTAVGGPIVGVVAGVVTGVATDASTSPTDVVDNLPPEQAADVLKNRQLWEAVEHIGVWIIMAGVFVIFILPLLMGWIGSAVKARRYKNEMVIVKENLFDNPNVSMKDLTHNRRKG